MIAACHALVFFYLTFPDKLSNSFIQHIYTGNLFYIYKNMKFKLHFMIFCTFVFSCIKWLISLMPVKCLFPVLIVIYILISVKKFVAYVIKINNSLTYLLINDKDCVSVSDWCIDVYTCTHRMFIALSWWLAAAQFSSHMAVMTTLWTSGF